MLEQVRKTAVVLALALCVVSVAPQAGQAGRRGTARSSSASLLGGVNVDGVSPRSLPREADRAIAAARQLHATAVRTEVPWSVMEPQAKGHIDSSALAYTDRLVNDAATSGIKVIMLVDSTPCWASSAPAKLLRRCSPSRASAANAWTPTDPSDFAAFTAYLAGRYGPRLAAIEIWNEPDQANEAYLAGPHKADHYAALLQAAYPAIKQADPELPVLAGSLVGSNGAFLKALYAAGIRGYYDGLSVHFYNLVLASLRSIHQVQRANGDSTPLWLDEFGWSSCWPHQRKQQEQGCVTARTQATDLANSFRILARTPYVAAAIVYKLQDTAREDFGLLSRAGARKPAFKRLARILRADAGAVSPVTLALRRRHGRVVAKGSAPVGDFMLLEAFQGATLRYRAVFVLNRFNRFSIRLPSVLGSHGLRVRVFQYGTGPARDAQKTI